MRRLSLSFALLVLGTPAWGTSGIYWHEDAADDPRPYQQDNPFSEDPLDQFKQEDALRRWESRASLVPTT